MKTNERYEWCNFWWEEADKQDKPRILLIGDSIVVGYRPFVSKELGASAYVDMLATSKAIDHPYLFNEFRYAWKHAHGQHRLIVFNNGLHGLHLSSSDYERYYSRFLKRLTSLVGSTPVMLISTTPVTRSGHVAEYDAKINLEVIRRNEAISRQSVMFHLPVIDLYTGVFGRDDYRDLDGYHYNETGKLALGRQIAESIRTALNLRD